jgi:FG-GAP-like repeat
MRRILQALTVAVAAVGAVVAAPGGAAAQTIGVPLASIDGDDVAHGLLALQLRLPAGARRVHADEPGAAQVRLGSGRCQVRVAVGGQLEEPTARDLPPQRTAIHAVVVDRRGRRTHIAARGSGGVPAEGGARGAVLDLRLPAASVPRFPLRQLWVLALQASPAKGCSPARLDHLLTSTLRAPTVRVTGVYAPDDPAPVVDLTARDHLTILGVGERDRTGEEMLSVGDTDGDGRPELALVLRPGGIEKRASAQLVNLGPLTGGLALADPAAATLTLTGMALNSTLAAGGDLDEDGRADLIVGRPGRDEDDAGTQAVVLGRSGGASVDVQQPGSAWLTVHGSATDCAAIEPDAVAAPGDLDGDGHPDLVVTASGCGPRAKRSPAGVWLIGGGAPGSVTLGADPRAVLLARAPDDALMKLAAVGDVNGDGLPDLAYSGQVIPNRSWAGVLFASPGAPPVDLARPGARGLVVASATCGDLSVDAPLGDANGDGLADVIVDGSDDCPPHADGGFVLFGSASAARLAPATVVRAHRGWAVDARLQPAGGDRSGDGLADLLAWPRDGESVFQVDGRAQPASAIQTRRLGATGRQYRLPPGEAGTPVEEVAAVPDADGDGRPDVAFGAPTGLVGGWGPGAVLVLGSRAG